MLNKIKIFFQSKKKMKQDMAFDRGYEYAAGQLLKGSKTPIVLDSEIIDEAFALSDCTRWFDIGIDAAIRDAIYRGLVEDDRL